MMKLAKYYISCFLFLSVACSNDKEEEVTTVTQLSPFTTVDLNSSFEVVLVQDSTNFIEVISIESLQSKIELKQENQTIIIENTKSLKWTDPVNTTPTLIIHSTNFKRVNANESCNITSTNAITGTEFGLILTDKANYANLQLDCDVFFYWNNFPCGGKLTLSGRTKELKLWNTAIMSIDAKNLVTDFALVENDSKGICEVNVLNKLEYKITGVGDIHLYGQPTELVEKEPASGGKLIQF